MMEVLSVRENPKSEAMAIAYFQKQWANEKSWKVYEDAIHSCLHTTNPLPQWYLLMDQEQIIGCAGLITNDFISRMDLYPWICALYIEEAYRGHAYGEMLLRKAQQDAYHNGFSTVYVCTDHIGYYERYQFIYLGVGYHPWGEQSRIYQSKVV